MMFLHEAYKQQNIGLDNVFAGTWSFKLWSW
jgi:hypothetical protein